MVARPTAADAKAKASFNARGSGNHQAASAVASNRPTSTRQARLPIRQRARRSRNARTNMSIAAPAAQAAHGTDNAAMRVEPGHAYWYAVPWSTSKAAAKVAMCAAYQAWLASRRLAHMTRL